VEPWVLIPIVGIIMWGIQGVARVLRGVPEPRAHRRAGRDVAGEPPPALDESVRSELEQLRQRVAELEERQDFTERMLTRGSQGDTGGP
jgi:hypothetical protein